MWALGKENCVLGGTVPSEHSANTCAQHSHLSVCAHSTQKAILFVVDNTHTILRRERANYRVSKKIGISIVFCCGFFVCLFVFGISQGTSGCEIPSLKTHCSLGCQGKG